VEVTGAWAHKDVWAMRALGNVFDRNGRRETAGVTV
jgi:hypothetical protein